jgi:hypothetical protein
VRATHAGACAIRAWIGSAALTLGACSAEPTPGRSELTSEECYALEYDDRDRADTTFFPRALALTAGAESGRVVAASQAAGAAAFWSLFGEGAEWRRLPGDSLGVTFSNGVSSTDLVVAHDGRRLAGRAAFRFQPESDPYPVLGVRGRRTDCAPTS